jgi:dynein heavy chain, axonemal
MTSGVQFEESGEIIGMESVEAEKVDFIEPIDPAATGAVELWLLKTESVMKRTLHKLAGDALKSYAQSERSRWILQWPGQLVLNCSQVYWTQVRYIYVEHSLQAHRHPHLTLTSMSACLACYELVC